MGFKSISPLLFSVIFVLSGISLQARQNYSEHGIKTYLKLCKMCHGNPYKGAAMYTTREWKRLFKDGDEKILSKHAKNEKAMSVLQTSYYKNRRRHLVKFLTTSASDSGVIPACDGNFCGD